MKNESKIEEQILKLKEKFPDYDVIKIDYHGSGDSFEGYDAPYVLVNSQWESISDLDSSEFEDLLSHAIENSSYCNFNNDGCRGTITIDLRMNSLSLDNITYVIEARDDEKEVFTDNEEKTVKLSVSKQKNLKKLLESDNYSDVCLGIELATNAGFNYSQVIEMIKNKDFI